MAVILCRLVQPESRLVFTLQPKPTDLTVRTSSKALVVNGRPFYGLVDIGGDAYLPLALGEGNDAPMSSFIYYSKWEDSDWDDMAFIDVDIYHLASVLPKYCVAPPSASVIGTAQPGPTVRISSRYNNDSKVPLLILDGQFPMVKISDLFRGCTINDQGSAVCVEIPFDSRKPFQKQEPDLVRQALSGLLRSTPKETMLSIHDYLVNTLTYNPFNPISQSAYKKVSEQYELEHNRVLACKYGVCQDYAELFQEMCLRAGIPCELVSGVAGGGPHAWNRVYVDGKWFHVDCTWDDPIGKKPILQHTYYLISGNHIKPALGEIPLEKLTEMNLQQLYKHLLESGRIERTESRSKPKSRRCGTSTR